MRKKLLIAAAICVSLGSIVIPQESTAAVIAIDLDIDRSGSISLADFALQKDGYTNVLTALAPNSNLAFGILTFGLDVINIANITIFDAAGKASLLAALSGISQVNGGATALGPAILSSQGRLLAFASANPGDEILKIDVSTDGDGNVGINQVTAANNAIIAGIDQVNCLGIGGSANCNFEAGIGSFQILVSDFGGFQTALAEKIAQETGTAPEPATLALLGLALAGLGFSRRRKSA